MATIILDAGHGGYDNGAVYQGRREKDDNLALTLAVGNILKSYPDIDVVYTRDNDIYETPSKKAQDANQSGGDYFVSIHRNSTPVPNSYSGVETLVYDQNSEAYRLARNIANQLSRIGFADLGTTERTNLVVLNQTDMPAALLEIGYINTDRDNLFFDENFDLIAQAIADGIVQTVRS